MHKPDFSRRAAMGLICSVPLMAWSGSYDDFFVAIRTDDAVVVQRLVARGFDPNTLNENGIHPLSLAIQEGSEKVARLLLSVPATRLNHENPVGETALMFACLKGRDDLAALLIAKGAQVNKTGWTPLHYAATGAHLPVLKRLLDASAYIDAESPNGTTPLMMAARYGSAQTVKLLLEEGADPTVVNQNRLNALEFAHSASQKESAELIESAMKVWLSRVRRP
jgi:ankyrin repeat protein